MDNDCQTPYSPGETVFIRLAARLDDENFPAAQTVRLNGGKYRLQLQEPREPGDYMAWRRGSTGNSWSNIFRVFIPGLVDDAGNRRPIQEFGNKLNAQSASDAMLAWPEEGYVLDINTRLSQLVVFYVYDQLWADNEGGLQIRIEPIVAPG